MMSLKKIRLTAITRAALVGVVLVGSVATAMLVARQGPAVLAKMTTAASPAPAAAAPTAKFVSAPPAQAAGRVKPTTPARAAGATPNAKPSLVTAAAKTPAAVTPANAAAKTPAAVTPANAAATTPAAVTPATAVAEAVEVITLTGCLQHDDGAFHLKDTIGADAPKARSWKSGFLKKRAASVEIVDSANRLRLPTHVGQKVSVTGVMLDREMRARSVQRVGVCS